MAGKLERKTVAVTAVDERGVMIVDGSIDELSALSVELCAQTEDWTVASGGDEQARLVRPPP